MAGLQLRNICEAEKKEVRTWIRQRKQRFASQQRKALKENSQIFLFLWQDCQRCCFSSLISSRQILNLSVTSNLQLLTLDVDQAASLPLTKKKSRWEMLSEVCLISGLSWPSSCIISHRNKHTVYDQEKTPNSWGCGTMQNRTPLCLLRKRWQVCRPASARSLLSLMPPGAGLSDAKLSDHISALKQLLESDSLLKKSWEKEVIKYSHLFYFFWNKQPFSLLTIQGTLSTCHGSECVLWL